MLDFYAAADAYASPSREDSFGLPVAEALSCGLPVITSAFAGVSDFVHEADGFVLKDPRDVESLAAMVRDLYARKPSASPPPRAAANPFWSWEQNADAVFSLLESKHPRRAPSPR